MVNPQLRAVWCTVSFDNIDFNGRRTVVTSAKYYIRIRVAHVSSSNKYDA